MEYLVWCVYLKLIELDKHTTAEDGTGQLMVNKLHCPFGTLLMTTPFRQVVFDNEHVDSSFRIFVRCLKLSILSYTVPMSCE